ncbi:hypothetical protein [Streptomyces sp. NPDC002537]
MTTLYPSDGDVVAACARHFSHGARLEEGALLRDAHRLAGIPGVLIHGPSVRRRDRRPHRRRPRPLLPRLSARGAT